MGVIEFFILLALIIVTIYLVKKQEKDEYSKKVQQMKEFEIDCNKYSNRQILASHGEEKFIKIYGKEQLEQIKSNRDTEMVKY